MRTAPAAAALLLAALAPACTSYKSVPLGATLAQEPPGVTFSSTPPGATVYVDGVDSGFLTPCFLDLGDGDWRRIDIARPGYRTATRILAPDWSVYAIYWSDMDHGPRTWRFPLWLGGGDLVPPVRFVRKLHPSRVHVRLVLAPEEDAEPLDEPPDDPADQPGAGDPADPGDEDGGDPDR